MKYMAGVCLIVAMLSATHAGVAQSSAEIPMQRGISVDMPATVNAVTVPDADKEDALVVTVTRDGSVYLGVNPITASGLSDRLRDALLQRADKTIYIKADAHIPYVSVIRVLDAVYAAGAEQVTLLTMQRGGTETGPLVVPKGFEMRVVHRR